MTATVTAMADIAAGVPEGAARQRVAIVGAGLIGRAFAMVFARAGWSVALYDPMDGVASTALEACGEGLATLARHNLCPEPGEAASRIHVAGTLAAAVDGASHVQECGPEDLAIKRDLFAALDGCAGPDAVLASSTSAITCSRFADALPGRHRCLVAHPVNPPHLVPLIELCGAPFTAPQTLSTARATFEAIGQAPITVTREVDGFVLNRLQGALLTEAFKLVAEGVVSPQDLDRTVSEGLGRRWAFMGPFQTIELNAPGGLGDYCARYAPFYARFAEGQGGADVWSAQTTAAVSEAWGPPPEPAEHATRTEDRNARLAALAAHLASQPPR